LSELLHINTRNIAAIVQLNTGSNFSKLLNTYRLADAEVMLRNKQEFSAEEIGLMSGFGSRQSFYRVFQENYGTTPRKFRLTHLEQQAQHT
jgi:AraC-like DNA-binding protein